MHALTGAPLAGLEVTDFRTVPTAQSDANGRFAIENAIHHKQWRTIRDVDGENLCDLEYDAALGETKDVGVVRCVPPLTGHPGRFGFFLDRDFKVVLDGDGPASRAGLREGDVATAIDDVPLSGLDGQVRMSLTEHVAAGTTYRITLTRGLTIPVTAEPEVERF